MLIITNFQAPDQDVAAAFQGTPFDFEPDFSEAWTTETIDDLLNVAPLHGQDKDIIF